MKELFNQCFVVLENDIPNTGFDFEKYTQLIVQECIDQCHSNFTGAIGTHASAHNSAVQKCIDNIKERFKIEK